MQALMLVLALLPQGQVPTAAWAVGAGHPPAGAIVVEGSIELSRAEADAAAMREAGQRLRDRDIDRARAVGDQSAPFWLPGFLVEREIDGWLRSTNSGREVQVLETTRREHAYSYGMSYRTTLLVADPAATAATAGAASSSWSEPQLERRLQRAGKLFLMKCGGIALFWGALALLYSWFDRLTRGYMSWRLRLLALALGGTVAPLVVLI